MNHSLATTALLFGTAFVSILLLALRAQKELSVHIKELEFFLKHRIMTSNQAKARLAVTQTRLEASEKENLKLKTELSQTLQEVNTLKDQVAKVEFKEWQEARDTPQSTEPGVVTTYKSTAYNNDFVLEQANQIQKLEIEVSSIQKLLSQDIKAQITEYMHEVNGLAEKLKSAREYTSTST